MCDNALKRGEQPCELPWDHFLTQFSGYDFGTPKILHNRLIEHDL